ncbi:MAG: uroporphyrinogen decarboxylase family protein, partial [Eubacterium sp.]
HHVLDDICDWQEVVQFPDLETWDWENAKLVDHISDIDRANNLVNIVVCNGMFERLHVLMGFEDALCALITEKEAVAAFFDAIVDYKIALIAKLKEHYNPDVITFHDDWGTQKALFFSPALWKELIKPRMKKIIDFTHQCGIGFIMHSCGKLDDIIEEVCEIGVDTLQCMDINDLERALKISQGRMNIQASVHTQDFVAKEESGTLTEEMVRQTVRSEFMTLGATGHYFPFLFITPDSTWYEKITLEEFLTCREALAHS